MCCCGRVIRSQGNPLCLGANRVLVAGYAALDGTISTSLIIATSRKHHSAASGREDGTSKMVDPWDYSHFASVFRDLGLDVGRVQLPDLLCLPCTMRCDRHSSIEVPGVNVPSRDGTLCFQSCGKYQVSWHFRRVPSTFKFNMPILIFS
jgi:hypothetical protein